MDKIHPPSPVKRPNNRARAIDRYSFTRLVLSETFVSQKRRRVLTRIRGENDKRVKEIKRMREWESESERERERDLKKREKKMKANRRRSRRPIAATVLDEGWRIEGRKGRSSPLAPPSSISPSICGVFERAANPADPSIHDEKIEKKRRGIRFSRERKRECWSNEWIIVCCDGDRVI